MSLQVWLPLNGDLHNQGLKNISVSSNNSSVSTNGKIGSCMKITSNTDLGYSHDFNTTGVSFGGWFKFNKSEVSSVVSNLTYNSTANSPTGNLIGNNYYGGIGLIWTGNNYYSSNNFSSMMIQSILRTSSTIQNTSGFYVDFDVWIHIFLTWDPDAHALNLYKNGILFNTKTSVEFSDGVTKNILLNYNAIWGGNGPSASIPMYCNDIRIYDHALSPLEVKHLAQGLVLHYPLSDAYIESTTNLITTEDCLSPTCYNAATSKYSYGTNTDIYKTVTTYDGRKGTKVYMGTNGNSCYPYVYVNNMFTSDGSNAPAYKTLSFDYYGTVGNYLGPYKLGSGEGTATYTVTCQGIKTTGTYSNFGGFTVTPNKWNHVEITFHGTTAANSEWGYIRIGNGNHTSNTSNFWFFANMQLEAKDHATGYVGVGNTRTVTTVYDTSGFGNNGTINGSLTVSSDTPKYNISTYVNSSSSINHSRCLSNDNQEWTCCAWVKLDGSTSYQQLNNFNNGNMVVYGTTPILYLNGGSDDYYMYGSQVIPVDEWAHIAFVFKNSTGLRNIYINGILKNNYGPNKTSTPSGIPDIVKLFGQNFSGYVSDYREYATALSADDVMALYKNAGYVDSDGNVYAYEMTE